MQQPTTFIPVAITPDEKQLEQQLLEAAARGDALLARRLAEKQPRRKLVIVAGRN